MKKNAPNARMSSGVRSTGNRAPQVSSGRTYKTKSSSRSGRGSGRKNNSNGKLIAGIAVISVAILIVVGLCFWITSGKSLFDEKYEVTLSDGSKDKMTYEELRKAMDSDVFYDGIRIDGIDVSGKSKEEAVSLVSNAFIQRPSEVNIKLSFDGKEYPLDLSSFPLEHNVTEVTDAAFSYARPAPDAPVEELVECFNLKEQLKSTPKDYMTAFTIKADGLSEKIHEILDPFDKPVKEARAESFDTETLQFIVSESQEGCSVDIDKAINDTKALLDSRTYQGVITVDFTVLVPTSSTEDLTKGMGKISSSSSNTTTDNSRNHNIRITCEKINGLVIQPDESFSFNEFVGERTPDKGYEMAGVILDGKSDKGYGGGICQLSTMIYQSVSKADLQIDERHPHDWPSFYCNPGLDATVDWPGLDFKFTNNTEYPIALIAYYDIDNFRVTVEVYGRLFEDGSYIGLTSESTTMASGTMTYVADPEMPVGETEKERDSHDEISAKSFKVWYDANGNVIKTEEYNSSYYKKIDGITKVGVLNSDGTLASVDPETGELTGAIDETDPTDDTSDTEGTVESKIPDPSDDTDPAPPSSEDTEPTPENVEEPQEQEQ